jgi:hypothetical protein
LIWRSSLAIAGCDCRPEFNRVPDGVHVVNDVTSGVIGNVLNLGSWMAELKLNLICFCFE